MGDWISIDDNMPTYGKLIVVSRDFGDGRGYYVTEWSEEEERFKKMNNITHWMAIERVK
jgi:hypothetical protein